MDRAAGPQDARSQWYGAGVRLKRGATVEGPLPRAWWCGCAAASAALSTGVTHASVPSKCCAQWSRVAPTKRCANSRRR